MTTKQERLHEVYNHLRSYFGIHTQIDFAEAIRITRPALSSAMNGNEAYLTKNLFQKICAAFPGVFDLDYLLTGKGALLTVKEEVKNEDVEKLANPPKPEIPDFAQRLFDEAVRMQTRNELLERQCEKLISELREAKSDNDTFIEELRKSKEFNDTLAAELKISRTQNENLITELRETRKENSSLTSKLESALDGIEEMKNQLAMMMGQYTSPQPSAFPMSVNEDDGSIKFFVTKLVDHDKKTKKQKDDLYALLPHGLIRGGRPDITDELARQAIEAFKHPKNKK